MKTIEAQIVLDAIAHLRRVFQLQGAQYYEDIHQNNPTANALRHIEKVVNRAHDLSTAVQKNARIIDTYDMMTADDYIERFKAEYAQTKYRYERLKSMNTQIEAAERTICMKNAVDMPEHTCPSGILREQQTIMGQYLHILEVRAMIEGVNLNGEAARDV